MNIYFSFLLGFFLLYETVMDIKYKSISIKSIIYFVLIETLAFFIFNGLKFNFIDVVCGMMPGLGIIILGSVSRVIGIGDGIVLTVIGAFVGINYIIKMIVLSFFIMGVFGIIVVATKRFGRKHNFPYIPFLFISYMGVILLG